MDEMYQKWQKATQRNSQTGRQFDQIQNSWILMRPAPLMRRNSFIECDNAHGIVLAFKDRGIAKNERQSDWSRPLHQREVVCEKVARST